MGVTIVIPRLGKILKAGELTQEAEAHSTNWTVSLLADDHLGDAFVWRVLVVYLITIDESDDISILLDCTRLT